MEERYAQEAQTLKELLALLHEHDLDRIKVKLGDAIFEVVRREGGDGAVAGVAVPAVEPVPPPGTPAEPAAAAPANVKKILAPLTGVFYRAPSPDAEVLVEVGDRVEQGDVLCILEAMKLFNEIQSDYSGTVVRIIPENGELVSQGEELFWIEP